MNFLGNIVVEANTTAESLDLPLNLSEQNVKDFYASRADLTGLELQQAVSHHSTLFKVRLKELWLERIRESRITHLTSTFKLDLNFQGSLKAHYLPIQYALSRRDKTTTLLNHWERLGKTLKTLQNTRSSNFAEIVKHYPSLNIYKETEESTGLSIYRLKLIIPPLTVIRIKKGASFWLTLGILPLLVDDKFQEITSYRHVISNDYHALVINPNLKQQFMDFTVHESTLPIGTSLEKSLDFLRSTEVNNRFLLSLEDCIAEFGSEPVDFQIEFYKYINLTQVTPEPISVTWNPTASLHDLKTKLNIEFSLSLEQYYNIPRGQFLVKATRGSKNLVIEPSLLLATYMKAKEYRALQLQIIELDEVTSTFLPSLDQVLIPLNCRLGDSKKEDQASADERKLNNLRTESKIIIPLISQNEQPKQEFSQELPLAILVNNQSSEESFIFSGSSPNYLAGYLTPSGRLREGCEITLRHLPSVISISIRKMTTSLAFAFKRAHTLFFLFTVELASDT